MITRDNYAEENSKTVDSWVKDGWIWSIPITHDSYLKAKEGFFDIVLTPTKNVPHEWFGNLKGKRVLALASGGGQQGPIFNALGADVTVLDYSNLQLEKEKEVALREGYEIKLIKADMSKPLPFENESFDLIFNPVSTCYIEKIEPLWKECFRILSKVKVNELIELSNRLKIFTRIKLTIFFSRSTCLNLLAPPFTSWSYNSS